MPVKPIKQGNKFVVGESSGKKTASSGTFSSRKAAQEQDNAINASLKKRGKI